MSARSTEAIKATFRQTIMSIRVGSNHRKNTIYRPNSLRVAVTTDAKPNPLGKTATHEWNQPLDSVRNRNEVRLTTGKAEVMTISQ